VFLLEVEEHELQLVQQVVARFPAA
jgi:hypothetical protein